MIDVYVYEVRLPTGVHEMVCPCADGYTVYLNRMDEQHSKIKHYMHAVGHILEGDFQKDDVQGIETDAHRRRR